MIDPSRRPVWINSGRDLRYNVPYGDNRVTALVPSEGLGVGLDAGFVAGLGHHTRSRRRVHRIHAALF